MLRNELQQIVLDEITNSMRNKKPISITSENKTILGEIQSMTPTAIWILDINYEKQIVQIDDIEKIEQKEGLHGQYKIRKCDVLTDKATWINLNDNTIGLKAISISRSTISIDAVNVTFYDNDNGLTQERK